MAEEEESPTSPGETIARASANSNQPHIKWSDSYTKANVAIESLSAILPSFPATLSSSNTPAAALLHDATVASQISALLRLPDSGAVNDNLCAWLYDTFLSSESDLHLVVLRFLPILVGVYLSRAGLHKPLPGFESVLLAIYAHETASRNGQAVTVSVPDLTHSSIYHETKQTAKNTATELHLGVISPSLEPFGTVRTTRRARIVSVALELFSSKIAQLPVGSKIDFCEFCKIWSGQDHVLNENIEDPNSEEKKIEKKEGGGSGGIPPPLPREKNGRRIYLPWELWQPILRVLGHCLMGPDRNEEVFQAAFSACKCLHARALHDINAKAILATKSLLNLAEMAADTSNVVDHTEIAMSNVITL